MTTETTEATTTNALPEILTTADVAAYFQVQPTTVCKWIREGRLRALALAGKQSEYRVTRDDLTSFLAALRATAPAATPEPTPQPKRPRKRRTKAEMAAAAAAAAS